MRSRCEAFEEIIWDHVRFGTPLSDEAAAHIDGCAECSKALNEARRVANVLIQADCVPQAPDCRRAVMDRIAGQQRVYRPVWAYASAGVALASVLIGGVITTSLVREPGSERVVKTDAPSQHTPAVPAAPAVSRQIQPAPELSNEPRKTDMAVAPDRPVKPAPTAVAKPPNSAQETPELVMMAKAPGTRSVDAYRDALSSFSINMDAVADVPDDPQPGHDTADEHAVAPRVSGTVATYSTADEEPGVTAKSAVGLRLSAVRSAPAPSEWSTDAADHAHRPVAIAVVSWGPPPAQPEETYSYSYTDEDPHTGHITTCTVERNGDMVYIHLEAKPEEKSPSERGSIGHESITDV